MTPEELKDRTQDFGLSVLKFVEQLPKDRSSDTIARQLIRAATSIGANYRAACRARSRNDFISKVGIVEEEADETAYWLELLSRIGGVPKVDTGRLLQEANELTAIFTATGRTTRRKSQEMFSNPKSEMKMMVPFTKMVGTGNDFVVVDLLAHPSLRRLARQWSAVARTLCDRHRGVGADGLLVLERSPRADVRMRIFNADGSEADMCGNGSRCVALYWTRVHRRGASSLTLDTRAGMLQAWVRGTRVRVQLTQPTKYRPRVMVQAAGQRVTGGFVDTGVPHFVVPVRSIASVDVERLGRLLRRHSAFGPQGTNVDFIQSDAKHARRLLVRTYERGVEAETLACGTGITASAVIHVLRHPAANGHAQDARRIEVQSRSGDLLTVSVRPARSARPDRPVAEVTLEGEASWVFDGMVNWRR